MPNKYEKYFSNWIFDNLPTSDMWLIVQDIDFVLQNYQKKRFMIIELKTRWNQLTYPQKQLYNMLHKRLVRSDHTDDWTYCWTYSLCFAWDDFNDWSVTLNWEYKHEHDIYDFLMSKLHFYE